MLKGFFGKIWLLGILCSIFSALLVLFAAAYYYIIHEEKKTIQYNETLIEIISHEIESGYLRGIWPYKTLNLASRSEDVLFLLVVRPNKQVFWANRPEMMGKGIEDPFLGVKETSLRDSYFEGERIKIIAHPLKIELREEPWTLLLGFSLKYFKEAQREIITFSITLFLLIVLLVGFISFYFSNKITRPLKLLSEELEAFGKGDPTRRVEIKTGDEIENLTKSFNKMVEDLSVSRTTLEESKEVLEIKVKARTRELQELAENLEMTVQERTKELQKRVDELERFHRLTVGRELKMRELKKELREKNSAKKPKKKNNQ